MIEVQDVGFRYAPDLPPALEHVSLTLEPGEAIGIVGPNGSGKSTIGRCIKGLLVPTEGRILVDGRDSALDGMAIRREVGLLFQNPNSQIVNGVVEHEVAFGPENLGMPPAEIRQRVDVALAAVGLTDRAEAECHALSMADKQRVALASVLAMEPHYLVLDEPTEWIEPAARAGMLAQVFRWAQDRGAGLVLVTHRMDEALLCARLYGILHGELLVQGPPIEVLNDPEMRSRLALAIPEAFALTSSLRTNGLPVVPGASIEQVADALWHS